MVTGDRGKRSEIREKSSCKNGLKVGNAEICRQLTLLHLFDGLLLFVDGRAEEREDDAGLGVHADGGDDHLAAALHHVRSRQQHRIEVFALLDVI